MTYKTLPRPSRTNEQVLEYTEAVERGYNSLFVVATDSGWSLSHAGSQKLLDTFIDRASAIASAKRLAKTQNTSFFVFNESGELVDKQ
jgi:hypothetical protein